MVTDPVDIHTWFGLTYANYLVMPRSVLQSMPERWQHKFTALLDECHEAFGHLDWPSYEVKALARPRELVQPKAPCDDCDGRGVDDDGELCEFCDSRGEVDDGDLRYETGEEVGYRAPIPHYNRGRTRLGPRAS